MLACEGLENDVPGGWLKLAAEIWPPADWSWAVLAPKMKDAASTGTRSHGLGASKVAAIVCTGGMAAASTQAFPG